MQTDDRTRIINKIQKELKEHNDPKIRNLAKENPDALTMACLLAPYLSESDDFDLRYISPGRSGAKVVLAVPSNELPFIIKFGRKEYIQKERNNYLSRVKNKMPQHIRADLKEEKVVEIGDYASIAYYWADGGWNEVQTFRSFFQNKLERENLPNLLRSLLTNMFNWHQIRQTSRLPFDQWKWESSNNLRVLKQKIDSWGKTKSEATQQLIALINTENSLRSDLITARCSKGTCHGDLNCHNILIAKTDQGNIPIIIDYASIRNDASPARDWAKLERDIKFRCLRDTIDDPNQFAEYLEKVDRICSLCEKPKLANQAIQTAVELISVIREQYTEQTRNISKIPYLEYLYYLFYYTLTVLLQDDELNESAVIQFAAIDSAYRISQLIHKLASSDKHSIYRRLPVEPARARPAIVEIKLSMKKLLKNASYASITNGSIDGSWLVTLHANRTTHLWAKDDLSRHVSIEPNYSDDYPTSSAMRPTSAGWELLIGQQNGFERWLIAKDDTAKLLKRDPFRNLVQLCYSADNSLLLLVSGDGLLEIRMANSDKLVHHFNCNEQLTKGTICGNTRYVIVGSETGKILMWYLPDRKLVRVNEHHNGKPISALIDLSSDLLYLSSGEDGRLAIYKCSMADPLSEISLKFPILCAARDTKTGLVLAGLNNKTLIAFDMLLSKQYWQISLLDLPASLTFIGAGFFALSNYNRTIEIRNSKNGNILATLIGFGVKDWLAIVNDRLTGIGYERFAGEGSSVFKIVSQDFGY